MFGYLLCWIEPIPYLVFFVHICLSRNVLLHVFCDGNFCSSPSLYSILLSIACNSGLMITNILILCISWNSLISLSVLKGNFVVYGSLVWQLFRAWNILLHAFLGLWLLVTDLIFYLDGFTFVGDLLFYLNHFSYCYIYLYFWHIFFNILLWSCLSGF